MRSEETILDLAQPLPVRTGVRQHMFYLVRQSKVHSESQSLARTGIASDCHVHMCVRLRGGAGGGRFHIEGSEWNCQSCGMVGCWPTKHQWFRCGNPRIARNGGAVGGKPRGPPRKQNAFGRPPPTPSMGEPHAPCASQRSASEQRHPSLRPHCHPGWEGRRHVSAPCFPTNAWISAGSYEPG